MGEQMNLIQIEREILNASKTNNLELIKKHRNTIDSRIKQIDYNVSRLLENRDINEKSKLYPFYNKQCEEYSQLNRLIRIINHKENRHV
jgi:predicted translin family RNA/ssDNA-binding protein